jgi:hypothetical protein
VAVVSSATLPRTDNCFLDRAGIKTLLSTTNRLRYLWLGDEDGFSLLLQIVMPYMSIISLMTVPMFELKWFRCNLSHGSDSGIVN